MRISLLLLFLLFLGTSGAPDSLTQIVSDLSILTRITNAIALQNTALQKTLKIREVVSELLRVDLDAFNGIVSLNTSFITGRFKNLFEKANAVLKNPTGNYSMNLYFRKSNSFIDQTTKHLAEFNKLKLYSADSLITRINANKGLKLPCDQKVLKIITKFSETLIKKQKYTKLMEHKYQSMMRNSTRKVLECFEACLNLKKPGKLHKELGKLMKVLNMHHELKFYNEILEPSFATFSTSLKDIATDIQKTEWLSVKQPPMALLIRNAAVDNWQILELPKPQGSQTAGFRSPGDLVKVSKDLESPWFKEKISRGKSIRELQGSLEMFGKWAEQVEKLKEPWDTLMKKEYREELRNAEERLHFEKFIAVDEIDKVKNSLEALEKSKNAFERCLTTSTPTKIDEQTMKTFVEHIEQPVVVYENINSVMHSAASVGKAVSLEIFQGFVEEMEKEIPVNFPETDVKNNRERIKQAKNIKAMLGVFEKMRHLYQAQAEYSASFDNLKTNLRFTKDTFKLETALDNSKLSDFLGCLETKKFDPLLVKEIARLLDYLLRIGKQEFYDVIHGFLERISRFQGVLDKVQEAAEAMSKGTRSRRKRMVSNLALKLNESQGLALHLADGMNVLHEMARAHRDRSTLLKPSEYPQAVMKVIKKAVNKLSTEEFWLAPKESLLPVLTGLDTLNNFSSEISNTDLLKIREVFKQAELVPGISRFSEIFEDIPEYLKNVATDPEALEAIRNSQELANWDLDFVSKKKSLNAAYQSVKVIFAYFDDIFGFKVVQRPVAANITVVEPHISYYTVVGICFGFFLLLFLVGIIGYGFTKKGRKKYRNIYLYYFPDEKEFERRWRYSLFMDRENGQNALIDASREINHINVKNILDQGAFVNVYSIFGNTPLHMATKRGFPKVVEVLIKNGANRDILNVQNRVPEQMIPVDMKDLKKEDVAKYEKIQKIYDKNRNKNFRIRVPKLFPSHLFHIYPEKRTNDELTNLFIEKFPGITSDEALPTTTHCICKTSEDGILETDDVDILAWIFSGVIMVKESWMTDCLADEKVINQDSKYLIESVRYKGVLYENCILPWSRAQAKGEMPFLYGVYVVFVMKECPKLATLTLIITTLGGVFLEQFPTKETFNPNAHPYLHMNLGPAFVIHDTLTDLSRYKNDKMFTLMTEEELISFLLKREIQQDTSEQPIPVLAD